MWGFCNFCSTARSCISMDVEEAHNKEKPGALLIASRALYILQHR